MPMNGRDRVVVIADPQAPDDRDRYRHCYWTDSPQRDWLGIPKDEKCVYTVAKSPRPSSRELFRSTRLLILNWDCANGDPELCSDATLTYLETQARVRIQELMRAGGTVFAECQTVQGVPVQKSYDSIFGPGEVTVTTEVREDSERRGDAVHIARKFVKHPLLAGVSRRTEQRYRDGGERLFYDRFQGKGPDTGMAFDRYRDSIWFGWFTHWSRGWVPLLYADLPPSYLDRNGGRQESAPVLLAKIDKNGLLLASTLWAGGARFSRLMTNIELVSHSLDKVKEYHKKVRRDRILGDVGAAVAILLVLAGVARAAAELAAPPGTGGFLWLISAGGVGLVSGTLAAVGWFVKYIWKRPFGVRVRESMRRNRSRRD